MIGLLVVLALGVAFWKWVLPSERFLSDFATLLTHPNITRDRLSFLSGRQYATGQFDGREVAIRMQLRRADYERGYLVIALRTAGPQTLNNEGIEARATDAVAKKALFDIAATDIVLNVEDGWLKALWRPPRLFGTFPGRFSEEKWRKVLSALHTVATALEKDATPDRPADA